ncbi:DUF3037 domain-containing protein [Rufibacter sp. LB8]|uniref:DUF3037 domain-containing protein n=1 Tax=Rufibacter sp. LB8 TaxID=2777781 RepID=UPI00178C5157|nr:DUF3037 domain-containing protein [Rufibacter sp. LB8]
MPERYLFEYAVLRVVPRVEREEFMNVGVILFCGPQKFLQAKFYIDEARLKAFSPTLDVEELNQRLQAFDRICCGGKNGGVIGAFPLASRFRWLTSTRSTVVQTSAVHPGLSENPAETLDKLFTALVL